MKVPLTRTIVTGIGTAVTCLLSIALASGQAGPKQLARPGQIAM